MADELLKRQQDAAATAASRMLKALMSYTPCDKLQVADVKFISEWCQTVTFDAIKEATDA